MGWLKRALGAPAAQAAAAALIAGYIRLVRATSSWRVIDFHHAIGLRDAGRPFLACFWHGRMMMLPFLWPAGEALPFRVLVSPHRDGRLIARVMARLGCATIDGSSRRNAAGALREMITRLKRGECLGITPDGPRGPRMRAKLGVAAAARAAGAPVLPIAFSTSRRKIMSSWDRLLLALPFGRGVYVIGAPIEPGDLDDEGFRALIEARLTEVTERADALAGVPTISAADSVATARRA